MRNDDVIEGGEFFPHGREKTKKLFLQNRVMLRGLLLPCSNVTFGFCVQCKDEEC